MSWLHDPRLRAESLLDVALGLRSTIARFDALLERYAPAEAEHGAATDELRDEWTLIVLGAIALRGRLDRELAGAAAAVDSVRSDRSVTDESLLR